MCEEPTTRETTSLIAHGNPDISTVSTHSRNTSQNPTLQDVNYGHIDLLSPWFPKVDPQYDRARGCLSWRTWQSKRQTLLWTAFTTSTTVLIVNLVFVSVLGGKHGIWSNRGVIPLYEGECTWVKEIGVGAHVGINMLSTLLLGASNLCMQLLVAPTRCEIDVAHRKKEWLDIGIPSWRNLRNIKRSRVRIWLLLGLSSIPLHFIYNSAISTSIPQYGYAAVVASESFLSGAPIGNWTEITSSGIEVYNKWPPMSLWNNWQAFLDVQANATDPSRFEKLTNEQCVEKYSDIFAIRGSLVVVTEDFAADKNYSVHQYIYWPAEYGVRSRYYPCYSSDVVSEATNPKCDDLRGNTPAHYEQFRRFDRKVLYCLSERIESRCRINYSPGIFIVVCCFSAVKCGCILATILAFRDPTISSIGDAIASFLDDPDDTSAHMGLVTKSMFARNRSSAWTKSTAREWLPRSYRYASGPGKRRWAATMILFLVVLIATLSSAIPAARGTQERISSKTFTWQMKQPIGVPSPDSFTAYYLPRDGTSGFISNVIFANIWQVIISLVYIAYNAFLTCMLVSDEWSRYATQRKTLRVTHPRGIQRSSYFISMPFKYGIPLMVANTALHILISQSTFIVSTIAYLPNLIEDEINSYTVTGYSTSATIISICVGVGTVILITLVSCIKLPAGMPLVSTCSIAISAACHRPAEDMDASLLPVQWGVVTAGDNVPVRCSFTTLRAVRAPRPGELICGEKDFCEVEWVVSTTRASRCLGWFKRLIGRKPRKT